VARLEAALSIIIEIDRTADYYRMMRLELPSFGTPCVVAKHALEKR
jgi:hypothetical protein